MVNGTDDLDLLEGHCQFFWGVDFGAFEGQHLLGFDVLNLDHRGAVAIAQFCGYSESFLELFVLDACHLTEGL
jgi:hypothetical protein